MKNVIKIIMVSLTIGLLSFTVSPDRNTSKTTAIQTITWNTESIEVGEIIQGTPNVVDFVFKNNGKESVIISNVQASCGCTATDYTKTTIEPGQTGTVTVTYNATSKGAFSKTVTVTTNASETPTVLIFRGTVI